MKKILSTLLSVIFSCSFVYAQWNVINVGTTQNINCIKTDVGFVWIGSSNQVIFGNVFGSFWNVITPLKNLNNIAIASPNILDIAPTGAVEALAVGTFASGNTEYILNTVNSGNNWSYASISTDASSPRYFNALDIYGGQILAVGTGGRMKRSINYGVNWTTIPTATTNLLADVNFISFDTVFAVGDNIILKSVDGGVNWTNKTINGIFKTVDGQKNVSYIGTIGSTLLKSIDYGTTYSTINLPFTYDGVLCAVGKDTILASASNGLYVSVSGGQYWEKFVLPSYKKIKMFDKDFNFKVYGAGDSGYVIKSATILLAPKIPISNFSISTNSGAYCINDSLSFNNLTIPGYSYQWEIDGVNYSNSYTTGIKFTSAGTHTVKLTTNYGSGSTVYSSLINVIGHSIPNSFVILADKDTVCNGTYVTFTIPVSEIGVKYQLQRGTQNILSPHIGNGSSITLNSYANSATTIYSVRAIKNSACFSDTIILYKTIYSGTLPTSTPFHLSKDSACFGDTASLIIPNSLRGFKYFINTSNYFYGNGSTISIPIPSINTNQSLAPKVTFVSGGCTTTLAPAKLLEVDDTLKTYFTVANYNPEVGEPVELINNSSRHIFSTYQWSFGSAASTPFSTLANPSSINYNSTGHNSIKLVVTSPFHCVDSLTKIVNVIATFSADSCNYSLVSAKQNDIMVALKTDYQGNLIEFIRPQTVSTYVAYSNHGDSIRTTLPTIPSSYYGSAHLITNTHGLHRNRPLDCRMRGLQAFCAGCVWQQLCGARYVRS